MSRRLVPALVVLAVVLAAAPASAEPKRDRARAVGVTLRSSVDEVSVGGEARLSGSIDPPSGGETVRIRDGAGALIATLTTGAAGGFRTDVTPVANTTYHAQWSGLDSDEVTVGVRAVISRLAVTDVRLFDTARAEGAITPARQGAEVTVRLLRGGRTVARRHPAMGPAGRFVATFPIRDVGTYRIRVRFDAPDLLAGIRTTNPRTTPLPNLREGSRDPFVVLLESRLRDLHFHLPPADRRFDFRTSDAVMAFRKVQRMPRNHAVTDATWRGLADPKRIRPRSGADGFHIEIDQTRQVLYTVRNGRVQAIIHTSTGRSSTPTRDGSFAVDRKIAGYSPNRLYYPSYFDGNRAIHGWPEVPSTAASHGCARVPYWTARWIFGLARLGTRVIVHHS
jgi:hypothetical protein